MDDMNVEISAVVLIIAAALSLLCATLCALSEGWIDCIGPIFVLL